jgi:hypothetical protein
MIVNVETTNPNLNWRVPIGKLWRDDKKRKLFEQELNFSPLIEGSNDEINWLKEAQIQSGHVEEYYDEFVVWGIRHLGLEDVVKVQLLEKRDHTEALN